MSEAQAVNVNRVGDGFFDTLRIPLMAGRAIERRDIRPNTDAVVVDELFARRFFRNQNPVGRRFGYGKENNSREIVGVVPNSSYNTLRGSAHPTIYEPYLSGHSGGRFTWPFAQPWNLDA